MSSSPTGVEYLMEPPEEATSSPEERTLASATLIHTPRPPVGALFQHIEPVTPPGVESSRTLLVTGRAPPRMVGSWGTSSLSPGRVLVGRYRLEEVLGSGGTSLVFRATDLQRGESSVALKVFNLPGNDEQRIARFKQEFRFASELQHPNIVKLFDVASDGDFHFLAMELLRGETLKSHVPRRLPLPQALRLLTHAAVALEYAHQKSVIHRDVKPANLFVTEQGLVKLMDFGLALAQSDPRITATGALLGTPEYMAPEQITGEHAPSPATDLYALGIVAYELVTGMVPFKHAQLMPLLFMHVKEPPRPPRELNPIVPVELEAVILKLLQKHPAERFASATQLRLALRGLWPEVIRAAGGTVPRGISEVP
jgi:serine/threonine-protein kinase